MQDPAPRHRLRIRLRAERRKRRAAEDSLLHTTNRYNTVEAERQHLLAAQKQFLALAENDEVARRALLHTIESYEKALEKRCDRAEEANEELRKELEGFKRPPRTWWQVLKASLQPHNIINTLAATGGWSALGTTWGIAVWEETHKVDRGKIWYGIGGTLVAYALLAFLTWFSTWLGDICSEDGKRARAEAKLARTEAKLARRSQTGIALLPV